ncbi:hypothetical protein IMZ48_16515 [Candidatus Bathyarchaeota archaeon]|nr:hypothetical protein [Candidatus Bathyarchaeota archaeon]
MLRPGEVPAVVVLPRPLSIVKRRGEGSESEGSRDGSAGTLGPGTPRPGRYEAGRGEAPSPPLRVKRVRPRALRTEGSQYSLRTVSPAVSCRDVPRALRTEGSLYSLRTVSPAVSPRDASFSGGTPGWGCEGSLLGEARGHAPYVLVPSVTITPEVEVVADGEATLWVAVEVGAQLGRPDGAGAMAGWNGWGPMQTDLSE